MVFCKTCVIIKKDIVDYFYVSGLEIIGNFVELGIFDTGMLFFWNRKLGPNVLFQKFVHTF